MGLKSIRVAGGGNAFTSCGDVAIPTLIRAVW